MSSKKQLIYIHGGMTFKSKNDYLQYLRNREVSLEGYDSWSGEYLEKKLGKYFDVIRPKMPLKENAKYEEWKIHFEKYIPLLKHDVVLVGYSLGGIFLVKYLSENLFPKRIRSTFIVAAPYDNTLPGEDLVGGFTLGKDLSLLKKNTKYLHLLFSHDDEVVEVAHAEKYKKKLAPEDITIYTDKVNHFFVAEFPELIQMIKKESGL